MANAEAKRADAVPSARARIEQSVLDAAAAGPSPPPEDRLRAATDFVMDHVQPRQLILFGSAARGDFSERSSDFDFLVVLPPDEGQPRFPNDQHRWECPGTGDEIDVIFAVPDMLENRRWTAGTVHCSALTEGITVFAAPGAELIETARDAGAEVMEMVRKGRYKPEKALGFLVEARKYLNRADHSIKNEFATGACKDLQEAAERALKSLIIANGSPFAYIHDLSKLWDAAEALGERIEAQRDEKALRTITEYSGRLGYDSPPEHKSRAAFNDFRRAAGDIVNYAERRVRTLVPDQQQTKAVDNSDPDAPAGG